MQPDHTENAFLFNLLEVTKNTEITLTDSLAMLPQNSVSTLAFANEKAFYFSVNEIDRDQIEDYARRKGVELKEMEKWLKQNLSYEVNID